MFDTGLLAPFLRTPIGRRVLALYRGTGPSAQSTSGDINFSPASEPARPPEATGAVPDKADRIADYLSAHPENERRIVLGGHWSNNPGWLLLDYPDQDITQPLKFPDDSVSCLFTEHVFEHIGFADAVSFLRECYRILRPGGVIRIVCPMLDTLMRTDLGNHRGRTYVKNGLAPFFTRENTLLHELGMGGVEAAPELFLFNAVFREHGHRFIWNISLLSRVLAAIGFEDPREEQIGRGRNPEYCIERRRRGLYMGNDWRVEMSSTTVYDPESGIVEAAKSN